MTSRKMQDKAKRLMLATVAAMLLSGCQIHNDPMDSGTTFAKDALQGYVDSGELPGAVNVFYKDGAQETCCIGWADMEKRRPITLDSAFMQCSQTKGFCGVTIAKLVEECRLNLDDPVSKYIPEFATLWVETMNTNGVRTLEKARNVLTVRMCLNHTGGFDFELPNYRAMGGWSRRMPLKSVAIMAAACPLLFEPGTRVKYSNVGIDIGAAVVEIVTGMRWESYLKETVLDPLGMGASTFWPTEDQLASKIELYDAGNGAKPVHMECHPAMTKPYGDDRVFPSAGAGLWTTSRDQLKFYKMLMNLGRGENGTRILKEETVKNLLAVSTRPRGIRTFPDDRIDDTYSLGLSAPETDGENAWFGHGGAWGTICIVNWQRRELKFWVVQLCNGTGPRPWDKARDEAADRFFRTIVDNSGANAYTGRMQ